MFYRRLKNFVKKIPVLWVFLRWLKRQFIVLSRLKDVCMMMTLFHIWPEQVYRFSTRKLLPSKKNRYSKESKPFMPFDLIKTKSSEIPIMEEINVVGVGSSFNLNNLKQLDGPTFLISFWFPLKTDNNGEVFYKHPNEWEEDNLKLRKMGRDFIDSGWQDIVDQKKSKNFTEFKKENVTYVMGRKEFIERFKKEGYNLMSIEPHGTDKDGKYYPVTDYWATPAFLNLFDSDRCRHISLEEKVYRPPLLAPYLKWPPFGSFLGALCALSYYAKKINVYGWDFYIDSSPKKMSYWKLFFNMYKYKPDVIRSRNHFESALINFYYGYQLSKLPNINIHSYLGDLNKHQRLIKKIERVLFN